jgi:N-glycosylase/DNA lyase
MQPKYVKITGLTDFSIAQIFDCGQCFRFDPNPDGSISGVAFGKYITFKQDGDTLYICGTDEEEYDRVWKRFLALDTDYGAIKKNLCAKPTSNADILQKAAEFGSGIRILRQEPWETVCSFIISANNNIPRIKKIISDMSEAYGEKTDGGYAFPTPRALYDAGEQKLRELKMGFRARYVYDAAERVVTGRLDFDAVKNADTAEAIKLLCEVKGIGLKVASCALLFGFGKNDVFPIDVWMKRLLQTHFPNGLDPADLGEYAGIAQQYLFYYMRWNKTAEDTGM